jgi:hypothetical protein
MAEFVQIGNVAFNPRYVVSIEFGEYRQWLTNDDFEIIPAVFVRFSSKLPTETFVGEEYRLFMEWWERKAEVYKVV